MKFLVTDREIQRIKDDAVENYKTEEYNSVEELKREGCKVGFDLSNPAIRVFSIERIWGSARDERTVIGYQLQKDDGAEIKEWTLLCSRNQHNQLAEILFNKKPSTPAKKPLLKG